MEHNILNVRREGEFYYPIYFEEDFAELSSGLKKENLVGRRVCIVSDSNVFPLYGDKVKKILESVEESVDVFVFEAGEPNKNLDTVQNLYRTLIENKIDRTGFLVALEAE